MLKAAGYWFISLIMLCCACKTGSNVSGLNERPGTFRVLGYLPASNNWTGGFEQLDLSKITDLNLAFINPDAMGNFPANDTFSSLVKKAHDKQVRIFFSIGGGSPPPHLEHWIKPDKRVQFVNAIVNFALKHNFDGVDVDLENALINEHYAPFIHALSNAIRPTGKLMTAALASWNGNLIHDSTINRFDFINIMSYDKTGPWNPNRPGPHAPFQMVKDDFTYFNQARSIPAGKLLVGLPFYGYGFGNGAPVSRRYRDIVNTYRGAEHSDSVVLSTGGTIYYNGLPTIRDKTSFAADNKAAGIMIWQLLGDATDSLSLLKAINDVKAAKGL